MRPLSSTLPLLILVVALAGCNAGRSASEPEFSTRSDVYRPGDEVALRLENDTEIPIGYNICFAFLALERRGEEGWEPVEVGLGPEPDAACTLELNGLAPGESAESTAYLPEDLEAGTYRIATDVEVADAPQALETQSFEVRV